MQMISDRPMNGSKVAYIPQDKIFRLDMPVRQTIELSEVAYSSGSEFVRECAKRRLNPLDEIKRGGYAAIYSPEDGTYSLIDPEAIYDPRGIVALSEFAERNGYVKVYLPSSFDKRPTEALGAVSKDAGMALGSGTQVRVTLSQRSGDTVDPSRETARQTLPSSTHGSITTNSSTTDTLPLSIGETHPNVDKTIFHSTDNPNNLNVAISRTMPFADILLRKLATLVPGTEYRGLDHPQGKDISYNKSLLGNDPPSTLSGLLSAKMFVEHEGQVPEILEALDKLVPSIPSHFHLEDPLGPGKGSHIVNIPFKTGISLQLHVSPKETRQALEEAHRKASGVHEWALPKIQEAQEAINGLINDAYDQHRKRVYGAGTPLHFSESMVKTNFFVDTSKTLNMLEPMPKDLVRELNVKGSPERYVKNGGDRQTLLHLAESNGYTAIATIDPNGYEIVEGLNGTYKANGQAMLQYAKSRNMAMVDEKGRLIKP